MGDANFQLNEPSNPWHNPIKDITWGFIFTMMTLNFRGLQYILPIIGAGLLYIGFYDLRKENRELNNAWIFSIINMLANILSLIYGNTPLSVNFRNNTIMIIALTVFHVSFLIVFRKGLKKVFEKGDIRPRKDPILRMIIWRVSILVFAITELGKLWFISIPVILFYFYNFILLYKVCKELEKVKFENLNNTVRLKSKNHVLKYIIGCIFIFILCSLVSNHIRLNSEEFTFPKTSQTRDMLVNMGLPEEIIKDISDSEVDMLKDATYVDVSSEMLMFDSKEKTVKEKFGTYKTIQEPGEINLKSTIIYVELKDDSMYGIEYFQWVGGNAYWHDGFKITGTEKLELINGKLLYEKNGTNYSATIPRLKNEIISESDWFGNENQFKAIAGAVNYPFGSDNQRGYVFYRLNMRDRVWAGSNILNYIHYRSPFRSPYEETENKNLMFDKKLRQHSFNFTTKAFRESND